MKIIIDEEFKNYIAKLDVDEYRQLKENIIREECRDPLVIWQETNMLLDGHHRYQICSEEKKIFKTVTISLPDRLHAKQWIINNQLGRRNLSPDMVRYLRGQQYKVEKQIQGEYQKPQNEVFVKGNTAKRLAKQHGVGHATIARDAVYATAVDKLAQSAGQEAKQDILSGRARLTSQEVIDLAAEGADKQRFTLEERRKRYEASKRVKEDSITPEELEMQAEAHRKVREQPGMKAIDQYERLNKLMSRTFNDYLKFKQETQLDFSKWTEEHAQFIHSQLADYLDIFVKIRSAIEQAYPRLKTRGLVRVK